MVPLVNLELTARLSAVKVTDAVMSWLAQDDYVHFVTGMYNDLPRYIDLQVQMLKHIALDARYGKCREDFMFVSRSGAETTFMLNLSQRSNFLGAEFTLENDSVEYRKVVDAIDANLASRMFKAALMTVRMGDIAHSRRFAERTREREIAKVREAEAQRLVADPAAVPRADGLIESEACPLWRKSIDANTKHRWARIGKVAQHTADSIMRDNGNPNDAMILFALQYLIPKELQ